MLHNMYSLNFIIQNRHPSKSNYSLKNEYEYVWILDTVATQYMTLQRDFFWKFQECQLNSIFKVDDTTHTPYVKVSMKVSLPRI
jgi:hypothetical protein